MTTDKCPTGFQPTLDFVYFREIPYETHFEESLIVRPNFTYLPNELENGGRRTSNRAAPKQDGVIMCRCIAVGPGRVLPSGAVRVPQVRPGQIFTVDCRVIVPGNVTIIDGDDGQPIKIITCDFINGVRDDLPPWAKEIVPGDEKRVLEVDLTPSASKAAAGSTN